ncbi:hypothetical protein EYF80_038341 [Liparis tanakae]|uniref:Uncharacterized protein n=1 Tax=Liparis tanakae TaxID=230148 RepID=A0A4Z2GE68_9TELE|nr:hypothetical protein EYF80_038341 [Liparis tanakae]
MRGEKGDNGGADDQDSESISSPCPAALSGDSLTEPAVPSIKTPEASSSSSSSSSSVIVTIVVCWSLLGVVVSARRGGDVDYQLMREVRPRVMKYTWLAPPARTEAKKT